MDVIHLLVSRKKFKILAYRYYSLCKKIWKLWNCYVYGVKEHVVCVICIKCTEVLYISVEVWYMGDEYEESYEHLFVLQQEVVCFYIVYELY